jgi:hypothetical protein
LEEEKRLNMINSSTLVADIPVSINHARSPIVNPNESQS